VTVVLAEKPSVAKDIARYLRATQRRDGYFEGGGYQVTWAYGHLVCLKEPEDYDPNLKKWRLETLPFVPNRFELKLTGDKLARKQFGVIKKLFKAANDVICATDAGREGELIFRYIQHLTGSASKPFKRLWLSSLTDDAIHDAFNNMQPGAQYDRLFHAARCRNEADWIVGLNATRNFTVRHGRRLWSVGRVQTPVLALIGARDDEIRHFKPEPFWELFTKYREVIFKFRGNRFTTQQDAENKCAAANETPFKITDIKIKRERSLPFLLYDLTDLQRDMNRRYGLAAATTLKIAQSLYEDKLLTYPRTDSRFLTADMKPEIPGILDKLRSIKNAEIAALDLRRLPFSGRIINDAKVTDHHAIIPTGKLPSSINDMAQKVYDAVVMRFIAAFYPPCLKDVTIVDGVAGTVPFRARGVTIVDPGWTALFPKPKPKQTAARNSKSDEDQTLPTFTRGESGAHEAFIKDGTTQPPKHHNENTLLAAMETAGKLIDDEALKEAMKEKGLGTPATRAAIIETLLAREYIVRDKKQLLATDAGRFLLCLVRSPLLKSAEMTGDWEARLKEIEHGRCEPRAFMQEIIDFTHQVIVDSESGSIDGSGFGNCPQCGREIIEGKRGYGCSGWRDGCKFVLWREQTGTELSIEQVRELIQRGCLADQIVIEGEKTRLAMTDYGDVVGVADSTGRPGATGGKGRPGGKGRKDSTIKSSSKGAKPNVQYKKPQTADKPIGDCPNCGKKVVPMPKSFSCEDWREGCQFVIWKQIAGKSISARTATTLLRKGRTAVLKRFKSKAGNPFDAALKLEDGRVVMDFGDD
jgi:DNA topoisomerase-3